MLSISINPKNPLVSIMEFGFVLALCALVGFAIVLVGLHINAEPAGRGKPEVFQAAAWWTAKVKQANADLPVKKRLSDEQLERFSTALAHQLAEYHDDHGTYPLLSYSTVERKLHPVLEAARQKGLMVQRGFCHPDGVSLPIVPPLPLPEGVFEMAIGAQEIVVSERGVVLNTRMKRHFGIIKEDSLAAQPLLKQTTIAVVPFPEAERAASA